jgi:hypothetical protein
LGNNRVGPEGGAALSEALCGLSGLETLNLTLNFIGTSGEAGLRAALPQVKRLLLEM